MFDSVTEMAGGLAAVVARLDPDAIPLPEAPDLWAAFDSIERLAAAGKVLLARRVDESKVWAKSGHRGAAEYLAAQAGTSIGAARDALETSAELARLPAIEQAVRAGEVSERQATAIVDAARANPSSERDLLAQAKTDSLCELRAHCLAAKAAADPDRRARHARIHRERRLRTFTDAEGAWNLVARGTPECGARVEAALAPLIDSVFADARAAGRREPLGAYAFDALGRMAARPSAGAELADVARQSGGSRNIRHLALLRVDLEALHRGEVGADETCEITGVGPIPVATARALLGESVLKLVITKGVDVLHVTHLGRGPSAAQKVALLWSLPMCAVEGCPHRRTEFDHRTPYALTRHTRVDDGDPLCRHHHDKKTYEGWALVVGAGKRPMVPPDDPRHPRWRRPP